MYNMYQGWENDNQCCSNCGLVECACDAQGLSDQEIEGQTCLIVGADHTWSIQEPGVPTQVCSFPINEDTSRIHTTTLRVGNLLVTIQEVQDDQSSK